MERYAKLHVRRGVIISHVEIFSSHNHTYRWHTLRVGVNKTTKNHNYIFVFNISRKNVWNRVYKAKVSHGWGKDQKRVLGGNGEVEGEGEGLA